MTLTNIFEISTEIVQVNDGTNASARYRDIGDNACLICDLPSVTSFESDSSISSEELGLSVMYTFPPVCSDIT